MTRKCGNYRSQTNAWHTGEEIKEHRTAKTQQKRSRTHLK